MPNTARLGAWGGARPPHEAFSRDVSGDATIAFAVEPVIYRAQTAPATYRAKTEPVTFRPKVGPIGGD